MTVLKSIAIVAGLILASLGVIVILNSLNAGNAGLQATQASGLGSGVGAIVMSGAAGAVMILLGILLAVLGVKNNDRRPAYILYPD